VRDQSTKEPFPVEAGVAFKFARACIEEGAAVYPGQSGADGQVGDHALVTPPLVISPEQVDDLVAIIDRALTRVEVLSS
jgi:adenosylmethionine-8-amino-7-oxononanoate aminotransferase